MISSRVEGYGISIRISNQLVEFRLPGMMLVPAHCCRPSRQGRLNEKMHRDPCMSENLTSFYSSSCSNMVVSIQLLFNASMK